MSSFKGCFIIHLFKLLALKKNLDFFSSSLFLIQNSLLFAGVSFPQADRNLLKNKICMAIEGNETNKWRKDFSGSGFRFSSTFSPPPQDNNHLADVLDLNNTQWILRELQKKKKIPLNLHIILKTISGHEWTFSCQICVNKNNQIEWFLTFTIIIGVRLVSACWVEDPGSSLAYTNIILPYTKTNT